MKDGIHNLNEQSLDHFIRKLEFNLTNETGHQAVVVQQYLDFAKSLLKNEPT